MGSYIPESPGGRYPDCTGEEVTLAKCTWRHPDHPGRVMADVPIASL